MDRLLTIGKLSRISGVSTRTIRHYEDVGLLHCAANTDSSYRLYSEVEVKRLEQILLLKSFGFSLPEIQTILSSEENQAVADMFEKKIRAFDVELARIKKHRETLEAITRIYKVHGLEYVNNYNLMKEIVCMNSIVVKIFSELDLKLQIKILKELYRTGSLSPNTLREMGVESGQRLLNELHMFLVKELLNRLDRDIEKNIMVSLQEEDPEFADEAKKAMFTFDDFAKLPDDTIKKWLKKCDDCELAIALKNSRNYLKNRILNNMEVERADRIKESIAAIGESSLDNVFTVMNNLIDVLRKMEAAGEIVIERLE